MTTYRASYKPNHSDFAKHLMSDAVLQVSVEAAQDVADIARALAAKGETGNYAQGFEVERVPEPWTAKGEVNPRRIAQVVNRDGAAVPKEFGNARTRKDRTLGKAGLRVGELRSKGYPL